MKEEKHKILIAIDKEINQLMTKKCLKKSTFINKLLKEYFQKELEKKND